MICFALIFAAVFLMVFYNVIKFLEIIRLIAFLRSEESSLNKKLKGKVL